MTAPRTEGGLRAAGSFEGRSEPGRPLVSIITVCYNSERHLEDTIRGVLEQTYGNIEYVLVDGGSTDGTLDIIRRYEDRLAYWVSEPDDGIYDAMNKGITLSTGELVGIINSDDWYAPNAVEEVVRACLRDEEAAVFHGNMYMLLGEDDELFRVAEGTTENILRRFEMNHPTCFVRRRVYDTYRFRTEYRVAADYELMLRLHSAGVKFHHIDSPLVHFRIGGASSDYYRPRLEIYRLRLEHGLITPREFRRKLLLLRGKALVQRFKRLIVNAFFGGDPQHRYIKRYMVHRDRFREWRAARRARAGSGGPGP